MNDNERRAPNDAIRSNDRRTTIGGDRNDPNFVGRAPTYSDDEWFSTASPVEDLVEGEVKSRTSSDATSPDAASTAPPQSVRSGGRGGDHLASGSSTETTVDPRFEPPSPSTDASASPARAPSPPILEPGDNFVHTALDSTDDEVENRFMSDISSISTTSNISRLSVRTAGHGDNLASASSTAATVAPRFDAPSPSTTASASSQPDRYAVVHESNLSPPRSMSSVGSGIRDGRHSAAVEAPSDSVASGNSYIRSDPSSEDASDSPVGGVNYFSGSSSSSDDEETRDGRDAATRYSTSSSDKSEIGYRGDMESFAESSNDLIDEADDLDSMSGTDRTVQATANANYTNAGFDPSASIGNAEPRERGHNAASTLSSLSSDESTNLNGNDGIQGQDYIGSSSKSTNGLVDGVETAEVLNDTSGNVGRILQETISANNTNEEVPFSAGPSASIDNPDGRDGVATGDCSLSPSDALKLSGDQGQDYDLDHKSSTDGTTNDFDTNAPNASMDDDDDEEEETRDYLLDSRAAASTTSPGIDTTTTEETGITFLNPDRHGKLIEQRSQCLPQKPSQEENFHKAEEAEDEAEEADNMQVDKKEDDKETENFCATKGDPAGNDVSQVQATGSSSSSTDTATGLADEAADGASTSTTVNGKPVTGIEALLLCYGSSESEREEAGLQEGHHDGNSGASIVDGKPPAVENPGSGNTNCSNLICNNYSGIGGTESLNERVDDFPPDDVPSAVVYPGIGTLGAEVMQKAHDGVAYRNVSSRKTSTQDPRPNRTTHQEPSNNSNLDLSGAKKRGVDTEYIPSGTGARNDDSQHGSRPEELQPMNNGLGTPGPTNGVPEYIDSFTWVGFLSPLSEATTPSTAPLHGTRAGDTTLMTHATHLGPPMTHQTELRDGADLLHEFNMEQSVEGSNNSSSSSNITAAVHASNEST